MVSYREGQGMEMRKEGREEGTSIADRLPELSEEERQQAVDPDNLRFALELANQPVGHLWVDQGETFCAILTVSKNVLRCVRVYDYEFGLWFLSMCQASCDAAGVSLQLGEYTLIAPVPTGEKDDTEGEDGEVETNMTKDYSDEFYRGWA